MKIFTAMTATSQGCLLFSWHTYLHSQTCLGDFYINICCTPISQFLADPLFSSRIWLWISDYSFAQCFLNIHWSGYTSCYMAGATWNSCRLGTSSVYTIQQVYCHYLKPHMQEACVFSCNLPPALWAKWAGSLCATAVTWGCNSGNMGMQQR